MKCRHKADTESEEEPEEEEESEEGWRPRRSVSRLASLLLSLT